MKSVKDPPVRCTEDRSAKIESELDYCWNWGIDHKYYYEIIKENMQKLNSKASIDMKMKDFDPEFLERIEYAKGIDNTIDKDKVLVTMTKNEIQDNHLDQAYYSASLVNDSNTKDKLLREIINKSMN